MRKEKKRKCQGISLKVWNISPSCILFVLSVTHWVSLRERKKKKTLISERPQLVTVDISNQTCSRILHRYQSEKRLTVKLAKKTWVLPRDCETDGQFIKGKVGAQKCVKECTEWVAKQVFDQPMRRLNMWYSYDHHYIEQSPTSLQPLWYPILLSKFKLDINKSFP